VITGTGMKRPCNTKVRTALCLLALLGLGKPALAAQDRVTGFPSGPVSGSSSADSLDPLIILGVEPAPTQEVDQQFLQPDEAFRFSTEVLDRNTVIARWRIANTYYMYRDKFKFTLPEASGMQLDTVVLPPGKIKTDPYFGRVEVYFKATEALISLIQNTKEATELKLEIGYQGCTELGLCYPPVIKKITLTLPPATE